MWQNSATTPLFCLLRFYIRRQQKLTWDKCTGSARLWFAFSGAGEWTTQKHDLYNTEKLPQRRVGRTANLVRKKTTKNLVPGSQSVLGDKSAFNIRLSLHHGLLSLNRDLVEDAFLLEQFARKAVCPTPRASPVHRCKNTDNSFR